jgi:hypothetical protein
MKVTIIILLFVLSSFAQRESWECVVTNKTMTGKDYVKTWDLKGGWFSHQFKDTLTSINLSSGFVRVLSLKGVKVKNTCNFFGFDYDKKENYCEGYLSVNALKEALKGHLPQKVLKDLVDTMSMEGLITMLTDKDVAEEILTLKDGYGERLNGRGDQNSFELSINRDDNYYLEESNGTLTTSNIRVNKRNHTFEMTMDATSWLSTFFEMKGDCKVID